MDFRSPAISASARIEPLSELVITTIPWPVAGNEDQIGLIADILPPFHERRAIPRFPAIAAPRP